MITFIESGNRIATENFETGEIYKISFTNTTKRTMCCIGIGTDFVMFQGKLPNILFCLTMGTAETVTTIDISTSGGTSNYNDLSNKPQINGIELVGNKTGSQLGLVSQSELDSKQDTLTTEQLTAVNSGITSSDVAQITTNENNILSVNNEIGNVYDVTVNIADTVEWKKDYYINNSGTLNYDTSYKTTAQFETSSNIIITNNEPNIYLSVAIYNENKVFESLRVYTSGNDDRTIEISSKKYVRVCTLKRNTAISIKRAEDAVLTKCIENIDAKIEPDFKMITTTAELLLAMKKGGKYYIAGGTYDIVSELGSDYFNSFSPNDRGPEMNDGVYIFAPNAYIVCDYSEGTQINAINGFSPINTSKAHNLKVIGMNINANNVKYALHDEMGGEQEPYSHEFINCTFSETNCYECLGGGLGYSGNIIIDGCIFGGTTIRGSSYECSYHNDYRAGAKSTIVIKNSVVLNDKTIRFGYYGDSTAVTKAIVSSCKLGDNPVLAQESQTYSNVNIELIDFGNTIY